MGAAAVTALKTHKNVVCIVNDEDMFSSVLAKMSSLDSDQQTPPDNEPADSLHLR